MSENRGLSRRQVLRVGAVVGSAVTLVAVSGQAASAAPVTDPNQATSRGDLGRVSAMGGAVATVAASKRANRTRVAATERVPYAGFPEGIAPRPGDLVTVTDNWDGLALAAVPVVHWLTGVPQRQADGSYQLDGESIAASPLLAAQAKKRVRVCVLDTELPVAQVLAVRAA
jgi:hypothetical protein